MSILRGCTCLYDNYGKHYPRRDCPTHGEEPGSRQLWKCPLCDLIIAQFPNQLDTNFEDKVSNHVDAHGRAE